MAKIDKQQWLCNNCGENFAKWQGQCSACKQWNCIIEFKIPKIKTAQRLGYSGHKLEQAVKLSSVKTGNTSRLVSGINEFDRVLGGGMVLGSSILIGGSPGAGKSTLLLQIMSAIADKYTGLYISGEESAQQIAMRSKRLHSNSENINLLIETNIDSILATMTTISPRVVVIDSIQVMYLDRQASSAGSVSQVRDSTATLVQFAKQNNIILLIVGHITKDGNLAGPKVLEHIIDCFLMMETSSDSRYRTLRSIKNRYGSVGELGIFAMLEKGLVGVKNPSAIFLSKAEKNTPGSVVTVLWEGSRPLLIEIQSLVAESPAPAPRRITVGCDKNRNSMLVAILLRHGNIAIGNMDIYINVVGGIKIEETSADLAILFSMLSSFSNKVVSYECICFGELGLAGEVRPVANGLQRLQEAKKQGFKYAIIPYGNKTNSISGMKLYPIKNVKEAIAVFEELESIAEKY